MSLSYELRAHLGNHAYVIGWDATREAAEARLKLAIGGGPWCEPAEVVEVEVPDPLPPVARKSAAA